MTRASLASTTSPRPSTSIPPLTTVPAGLSRARRRGLQLLLDQITGVTRPPRPRPNGWPRSSSFAPARRHHLGVRQRRRRRRRDTGQCGLRADHAQRARGGPVLTGSIRNPGTTGGTRTRFAVPRQPRIAVANRRLHLFQRRAAPTRRAICTYERSTPPEPRLRRSKQLTCRHRGHPYSRGQPEPQRTTSTLSLGCGVRGRARLSP